MTHHQIIREEMQAATNAIAEITESINKLTSQRDRFVVFVEAMGSALNSIPEQLEFELDTPENVTQFAQ